MMPHTDEPIPYDAIIDELISQRDAAIAALEAMTPMNPLDYTLQPPVCRFCGADHPNPNCQWSQARAALRLARGETE